MIVEIMKYLWWNHMVSYFCYHLSDNYVDLSDLYVDLSLIHLLENTS